LREVLANTGGVMPQVLQVWKAADPFFAPNLAGPPPNGARQVLRGLIADAAGGFTAVWDNGLTSFFSDIYSGGYDAFGYALGTATQGRFFTGFVEWGGGMDEVFRGTGGKLVLTNIEFITPGLSPGPPLEWSLRTVNVNSVSEIGIGGLFGYGTGISGSYTSPTIFSTDTTQLRNGGLVTILAADETAAVFPGPQPAVSSSVQVIVRDGLGVVLSTITLAAPSGPGFTDAAVAGFANSDFVGVWTDPSASLGNIVARRVVGGVEQAAVTVNQTTAQAQTRATAATMADGNVVILWQDASGAGGDASGTSIKGRIMRQDGTFSTNEFLVNQSTTGDQLTPTVVGLAVNQFLAVWIDNSGGPRTLRGRVFDFAGAAVTPEITIATATTALDFADVTAAVLSDGRVAVGWYDATFGPTYVSRSVILDPRPEIIFGTANGETILGRGYFNADLPDETIVAGGGNDTIWGFAGDDHLYGEAGLDLIYAGNGNDLVNGGAGNDTLWGEIYSTETGNDTILGGDGDDLVFAMAGNDSVLGEAGNDTLLGGEGADTLFGGDNNDALYGEGGADTALGGNGDDAVFGMDGADSLLGEAGGDTLLGGNDSDSLFGGIGSDALYGDDGVDFLYGEADPDFLFGQAGSDLLYGGDGIDVLLGGTEADLLYGEAGADALYGEDGNDTLVGGADGDTYFTGTGADVIQLGAAFGVDVVYDFVDGQDRIQFLAASGVANIGQLTIIDVPGYAVVVSGTNALYVYGFTAAQLTGADFIFGG
jgi:Ca2+-binding RTX toxin-like protein